MPANPAEDLGWLCVKAWRFGAAPPVAGLGSPRGAAGGLPAAGGADISLAELRWWEILGTLRWGVICMTQAWAHLSGAYRSVELAAIGRRVCEQEWDLLLLAAARTRRPRRRARRPRPSGAAAGGARAVWPADRQRAARRRSGSTCSTASCPRRRGQLAFHARVAANVLAIVARELELGPAPRRRRARRRGGGRLAVANPGYFDRLDPRPSYPRRR